MKKTLSIVLALTMLFALCVPSFAAVTSGKIDQTGSTVGVAQATTDGTHATIKTEASPEIIAAGGVFSVEFPAETAIAWNALTTTLPCTVYANLLGTHTLTVTAAPKDKDGMVGNNVPTKKIPFTIASDTLKTETGLTNADLTQNFNPVVTITQDSWNRAPITDTYTGFVTFTATVNN